MSSKVQEILTNSMLRTKIGVLQKYKQCLKIAILKTIISFNKSFLETSNFCIVSNYLIVYSHTGKPLDMNIID
jgi:hypothetical protein